MKKRPMPAAAAQDAVVIRSDLTALDAAVERAVTGALRSTIHDHGPITPQQIGSAVKRVVGQLRNARAPESEAAAALGRKGGTAGRGAAKVRGGSRHYGAMSRGRWASMTAEERSAEMKRRAAKRKRRKKA